MPLSTDNAVAALDRIAAALPPAALRAAQGMGDVGERAIKQKLNMTAHAQGTPSPSAAGSAPSHVSGRLIGSVQKVMEMPGPRSSVAIAPTAVYARIQELGGDSGAGHATHLPPRPYVRPAVEETVMLAREAAIRAIRAAMAA